MAGSELGQAGVAQARSRLDALTPSDIAAGLALSGAAGWNQTADDWAFFIAEGKAIGVRAEGRGLVATAAWLGYGECAWISLVLVAVAARHQGLASALVAKCIEQVRRAGQTPVLDATPAGAAVYAALGFAQGFAFSRWEGARPGPTAPAVAAVSDAPAVAGDPGIVPCADSPSAVDRIAALDRAAHGLDRRPLLAALAARSGTRIWPSRDGQGFVVARAGRNAWQVGPIVAADEAMAIELLLAAIGGLPSASKRVIVDVPVAREQVARALSDRGFAMQRPFVRMVLGDHASSRLGARSFALAGPEYG